MHIDMQTISRHHPGKMAQRFQNTNQLFSIQRTTLQRQLYKFKAQPSTFQVEGNKYNYMGNGIYIWNGYAGGGKKAGCKFTAIEKD